MQDTIMEAEAEFQQFKRECEEEFSALPQTMAGMKAMWASLPPAVKEQMKTMDKVQYQELAEFLK